VFLLGVFWKRATTKAGRWTLIVGFVLGMFRLIMKVVTNKWVVPDNIMALEGTKEFAKENWITQAATNPPVDLSWFGKFININWLHYEIYLFIYFVYCCVNRN